MAYSYTNKKGITYYLNERKVTLRGSGREQTIYYFTKNDGKTTIDEVPAGFKVEETQRSGLPVLKKK